LLRLGGAVPSWWRRSLAERMRRRHRRRSASSVVSAFLARITDSIDDRKYPRAERGSCRKHRDGGAPGPRLFDAVRPPEWRWDVLDAATEAMRPRYQRLTSSS
jgi:hypothetical protein